jgi:3-methyl-2-oxobutanoate hydroxymethyltransferase
LASEQGKPPRHARVYGEVGEAISTALQAYVAEVQAGAFPADAQSSKMDEAVLREALLGL